MSGGATGTASTSRAARARQAREGGPHRPARGDAVIDEDHGPARGVERGAAADISHAPPLQLRELAPGLGLNVGPRRLDHVHDRRAEDDLRGRAVHQRTHAQLWVTRSADLAHDQDLKRRAERPRHLEAHRHSAARQRNDDGPLERSGAGHVPERVGQLLARLAAIAEAHGGSPIPRTYIASLLRWARLLRDLAPR